MKQKKVMLLGGNYYQMTATKAAKRLGYYVISVDYLPNNPAHKFADEYYNVSTTDKEAVLELAKQLKIDGILSFASDVSAPTVAYVAKKLGLAGNPYDSVLTIVRKDLLKRFLKDHGFHIAHGDGFQDVCAAFDFYNSIGKPCIIKPSDSSGSKGVFKVNDSSEFNKAFSEAMAFSASKTVVVEEYIKRKKHQIAGDGFMINGELMFAGLMNSHFDDTCNPFVPIGSSYPSEVTEDIKIKVCNEVQRLMNLLQIDNGAVNWDIIIDGNDDVYIIDIGPRNGGNMISEAIRLATGIDLAEYSVKLAVGDDVSDLSSAKKGNRFVAAYNIHSTENGRFDKLYINDDIKNDILFYELFVKPGDNIQKFQNGRLAVGTALIKNDSIDEMIFRMDHIKDYFRTVVV